jgi:hypothetical protein
VEQPGADDLYAAVAGTWYDTNMTDEIIILHNDGKAEASGGDLYYSGTYTFDPFEQKGVITLTDGTNSEDYEFYLSGDVMYIGEYTYSLHPPVATDTASILGTWYDIAGMQGTLYFDKDGLAVMDSYGTMFYGTYAFDEAAGTGTMTLEFVEGPFPWNLTMWEGLLYTDDTMYTKEYVEQTTETNAG